MPQWYTISDCTVSKPNDIGALQRAISQLKQDLERKDRLLSLTSETNAKFNADWLTAISEKDKVSDDSRVASTSFHWFQLATILPQTK